MNWGTVVNCALAPGALLLLALPALANSQARRWIPVVVLVALADSAATLLPILDKHLQLPGAHWNWSGKLIDIAVMGAIAIGLIVSGAFRARDFGLTLRQAPGTARALVFMALPFLLAILVLTATMFGESKPPTAETLQYQATLPGLAEELVWRGMLLALFDRMFAGRFALWGAPIGYGAIATSLVFGLLHGAQFDSKLVLHTSVLAGLVPGLTGFLLAWLRVRTKSLVFPVLLHNATNVILEAVPLLLH